MKVLFAVNLTEPLDVVRKVEDLCDRLGADLYVIHVGGPTAADISKLGDAGLLDLYAHAVDDDYAHGALPIERRPAFDDFVRRSFTRRVKPMLHESPDISSMIAEAVERIGADILVIGQRPHALLERMVVGSVSSRLMRSVDIPTLMIPIRS